MKAITVGCGMAHTVVLTICGIAKTLDIGFFGLLKIFHHQLIGGDDAF